MVHMSTTQLVSFFKHLVNPSTARTCLGFREEPTSLVFGEPIYPLGLAGGAEAQSFLRVSRTTLWRLERRGALQPIRIGVA